MSRVEVLNTLSSQSQPGASPNGARFVRDGRPFDDIAVWKMDGLTDADPAFGGAAWQHRWRQGHTEPPTGTRAQDFRATSVLWSRCLKLSWGSFPRARQAESQARRKAIFEAGIFADYESNLGETDQRSLTIGHYFEERRALQVPVGRAPECSFLSRAERRDQALTG